MKLTLARALGSCLSVIGFSLFVIFASSINAAQYDGGPMDMSPFFYVIPGLALIFLAMAIGGTKLVGLSWDTIGLFAMAVGLSVLILGAWNYLNRPPIDAQIVETDIHKRIPASSEENIIVCVLAGLGFSGGLSVVMISKFKRKSHHSKATVDC